MQINETKPQVLKIFDSFGDNPKQVKAISPDTIIVGRIYISSQPMNGDPVTAAQIWWSQVNTTILANPDVDYWEGYNEVVGGGDDQNSYEQMVWYSQMEVARMQIMQEHGVKACIGNFATGCPSLNATIVEAFFPAIKAAKEQYNGILGLHEYSAPWLNTWYNETTGLGWLTGRYHRLYQQYLQPNNLVIPLVITEMGIDGQVGSNTTPNIGGWQDFCSYWAGNGGLSDCDQEYTNQLAWYDSIMLQDSYMLGATIFCLEIPGWSSWQLKEATVDDIIYYMNNNVSVNV